MNSTPSYYQIRQWAKSNGYSAIRGSGWIYDENGKVACMGYERLYQNHKKEIQHWLESKKKGGKK